MFKEVISAFIIIALCCLIIGAPLYCTLRVPDPKFAVGDCLIKEYTGEPERWDLPDVRVLEIGKQNYLVRDFLQVRDATLSFGVQKYYRKLDCKGW